MNVFVSALLTLSLSVSLYHYHCHYGSSSFRHFEELKIFNMSWIEKPAQDVVGSFVLSTLGIDEAYVNVTSFASQKLWLYELSSDCKKCPFRLASEIVEDAGTSKRFSTKFPTTFRLRTTDTPEMVMVEGDSAKFCDVDYNWGEFGVYNIFASNDGNERSCEVSVAAEPVNIYLPIAIVVIFYFLLFAAINILSRLWKRSKKSAAGGGSDASLTSLVTTNGQKKKNESQTDKNAPDANANANGSPSPPQHQTPSSPTQSSQTSRVKSPSPPRQKQRLRSLDTFRGLCIVVMIFVNDGGAHYYFLEHATWDGLYVADLVFPWFLWIMGVCIPIAIKSQIKRGTPRLKIFQTIVERSIKLACIGLILSSRNGVRFGNDANMRIPGILQRFGVCYLVCATLVLVSMSVEISKPEANKIKAMFQDILIIWAPWLIVLLIVAIHCIVTFVVPMPDCPTGYLGPGGLYDYHPDKEVKPDCIGGMAGYLDRQIFTSKHIYQWPTTIKTYNSGVYDPEGFLGTLTSIFQVWLGVQAGATMLVFPRANSRLIRWGIWAIVTGGIGALLCGGQQTGWWIPVNKNLWSLSFVLVTSSFALILLSTFYILIDIKNYWSGSPFYESGMNSILLYVGHSNFSQHLPWHWSAGMMGTHFIWLCESLWGTSLWVLIGMWLHHKKIYWSV